MKHDIRAHALKSSHKLLPHIYLCRSASMMAKMATCMCGTGGGITCVSNFNARQGPGSCGKGGHGGSGSGACFAAVMLVLAFFFTFFLRFFLLVGEAAAAAAAMKLSLSGNGSFLAVATAHASWYCLLSSAAASEATFASSAATAAAFFAAIPAAWLDSTLSLACLAAACTVAAHCTS